MVARGANFKQVPLNIVGSSIYGRYPKISTEYTLNMFVSDNFLVPYAGYEVALTSSNFRGAKVGRGAFNSTKLNRMVLVFDSNVFLATLNFNQVSNKITYHQVIYIGSLETDTGVVYITENNKPQILISDGKSLYIYDQTLTPAFAAVPNLNFTPGYVTFHDTYFICAASSDQTYTPPANNTWRLSLQNQGMTQPLASPAIDAWPNTAANVGLLQTKPDNVQAVLRFPSKGNMIFVMGSIVTEAWFDTGAQLFPYQRNNQYNIDYGCLSPATVAYMDQNVAWLASNEKSGPIIMYSDGGMPNKITTDGIDYQFAQLQAPEDSQAFMFRQDGHLFYHINFYTDNLSFVYDFNADKFYNASDQNRNYFIASELCFFDNQYYFVSRNSGNLYAFDTIFTSYQETNADGTLIDHEIPRIRICHNVRLPSQEYFVANDIGFTIETGETDYQQQLLGPYQLITQDGHPLITQGFDEQMQTQDLNYITDQAGNDFVYQQTSTEDYGYLIAQQQAIQYTTPAVDLSISTDGGATFGNDVRYVLNPIGQRKNKLIWWQCGIANDLVCQFKYWGMNSRWVCTDGEVNIRQ
jgi:hypothetical protein